MRKITGQAVYAFMNGQQFNSGNTQVVVLSPDGRTSALKLHGNVIATRALGVVKGSLAGWPTVTTRERLNGVCDWFNAGSVYQKDGVQFFNDEAIGPDQWFTIAEGVK